MRLFKRNRDAELWPNAELWVLFPDGSVRVDKNPDTTQGILVSNKFKQVYRLTQPVPLCDWPHGKEPGVQPIPTGKLVWFMTGDESELLSDDELQAACEHVFVSVSNHALEKSIKRREIVWWISIGGLALTVLLRFANVVDVVRGW